jgi:spectinomycin phosphotransferase
MYAEPDDLDRRQLIAALWATWELRISSLGYAPVGFGSHHYSAPDETGRRWFVTVDDLAAKRWLAAPPDGAFGALEAAFRTAVALQGAGLEFVHAPMVGRNGDVLARIGERYAASVFSYIDGTSGPTEGSVPPTQRHLVLRALGRLHAQGLGSIPRSCRRETQGVPLRDRLLAALDDLHRAWTGGPYAEATRRLLADNSGHVVELSQQYDELARAVLGRGERWVVTHGEPHGRNTMTTGSGAVVLIDWDTVAVGPRERDLWMVEPQDAEDWAAYAAAGPADPPDPAAIQLYRLRWQLAEIADYTEAFRSPHREDANTQAAWADLQSYFVGVGSALG